MSWQKYVIAFLITAAIFATAFYATSRLDQVRIADIRMTESQVSLDILSNETQYDLLSELSCSEISQNPGLSDELNTLASQLSYAEQNLGTTNPEVVSLKEQYSLLEIKDYILMQKISVKCGVHPVFILYFYSNTGNCPDCAAAGDVLTYLRTTYPSLRVYAFDYNLDTPALRTLISLRSVKQNLPAYIIDSRSPIYGLKTADELIMIAPEIGKLSTTTPKTASST
jgi:hypothetical protein